MPSEIRHVLFQPPEVVEAIGAFYRQVGRAVPPGIVTHCAPERQNPTSPARFRMTIEHDQAPVEPGMPTTGLPDKQRLVVEGADLAAALILYCRANKIPLPARATKSLEIFGGQLCLAFTRPGRKDAGTGGKLRL